MRRTGTPDDLVTRPGPLAIVLVILHRGPQSLQELERVVGVRSGTIRYHVAALHHAGVVAFIAEVKPKLVRLVDVPGVSRMLDKARPGWAQGGIPRGSLWGEVQAAIDTRRVRNNYHTRIALQPTRPGFLSLKRQK